MTDLVNEAIIRNALSKREALTEEEFQTLYDNLTLAEMENLPLDLWRRCMDENTIREVRGMIEDEAKDTCWCSSPHVPEKG